MPALIQDVLIVAALFALGASAVRALLGRVDWLALASLGVGLGGGLFTWTLFLLSWGGLRLVPSTLILAYVALLGAFSVAGRRAAKSTLRLEPAKSHPQGRVALWATRAVWSIVVVLIGTAFCLAIGLSYYTWDAIANWSVKGYGMALEGSVLGGATWGSVGLSYPMNLPLLIAVFRVLDGDPLPGSKLLFPLLYASLLLGCYRFWKGQGLRSFEAALGTLLLAATPIFFWHATSGYANLAFTFYLSLGVLWVIEGNQTSGGRKSLMGGTLLALSIWTRPEGLLMCVGVLVALILYRFLSRRERLGLVPVVGAPILVAFSWIAFSLTHPVGEAEAYELTSLAWKGLTGGDIRWGSIVVIIRFVAGQVVRYRDWGYTLVLAGGLSLIGLQPRKIGRDAVRASLILIITVLSVIVFGAHYMAAYSPHGPGWVYEWLSLNFNRLFMPVGTLLTILGILTLRRPAAGEPQELITA